MHKQNCTSQYTYRVAKMRPQFWWIAIYNIEIGQQPLTTGPLLCNRHHWSPSSFHINIKFVKAQIYISSNSLGETPIWLLYSFHLITYEWSTFWKRYIEYKCTSGNTILKIKRDPGYGKTKSLVNLFQKIVNLFACVLI